MSVYLAHHGVKGQKWGVRRYQNKDGSYTNEGKRRRGDTLKQKIKPLKQKIKPKVDKAKRFGNAYLDYYEARFDARYNPSKAGARVTYGFLSRLTGDSFSNGISQYSRDAGHDYVTKKYGKKMANKVEIANLTTLAAFSLGAYAFGEHLRNTPTYEIPD